MRCISRNSILPLLNPRAARGLLAALLLAGCAELDSPDESQLAADDAELEFPPTPDLDADTLAALQGERTVASLPVAGAGTVEIVDAGLPGAPAYTYLALGGRRTTDLLDQLVAAQGATPAEVFLALAEPARPLPERLLADHRTRAAADPSLDDEPRRLSYTTPRTFENDNHDCLGNGGNPKSFANWLSDWDDRFEFINFKQPNRFTARNTSDGGTNYGLSGDYFGRVLSACNAANNDVLVYYWAVTNAPGIYYPYSFVAAAALDSFDASHLYETGKNLWPYVMTVGHTHPDPDTYVAYGRCGNSSC